MNRRLIRVSTIVIAAIAAGACSDDATSPNDLETALLAIVPPGGAIDVNPNAPVVVRFDHPVGYSMAEHAEVRKEDMDGALVEGAWNLSDDRMTLTFTPDQPLEPLTTYVIHLGGGMLDEHGAHLNFERHGFDLGGEWCTEEQMGMGPMGPVGFQHRHGADWRHPNGTYGMFFTFTTSG